MFKLDGILNVLKPPGMTSHDVVAFIRRLLKIKKVGHTGTLDPDVAGVLPICLGKATKVIQYLTDNDKQYRGEIIFGIVTDTQDISGDVLEERDATQLSVEKMIQIFSQFNGEVWQIPPMVSAVKVKGKRLYEYAREGREIVREPRKIKINSLNIIRHYHFGAKHPKVMFDVSCSKGTYIRTLCNDIGEKSGYGASMSYLLRTRSGIFSIKDALTLEEIRCFWENGNFESKLLSISQALADMPEVIVYQGLINKIQSGNKIYAPGVLKQPEDLIAGSKVCLKDFNGNCFAIAETRIDSEDEQKFLFQPVKVF